MRLRQYYTVTILFLYIRSARFRSMAKLQDHQHHFERLQAELEMYTEMLSGLVILRMLVSLIYIAYQISLDMSLLLADVVARRRLRASYSQIQHIQKLARSKRLEMEELVYLFTVGEAMDLQEHNNRNNYSSSSRGTRSPNSATRSRTARS